MFRNTIQEYMTQKLWVSLSATFALLIILGSLGGLWRALTHEINLPERSTLAVVEQTREAERIFGVYQAPLALAATEKLALQGVFTSSDPQSGSAIIATKGQPGKLYVVGDAVPGGARLIAVHESEIALDVNGQQSILKLPEKHL